MTSVKHCDGCSKKLKPGDVYWEMSVSIDALARMTGSTVVETGINDANGYPLTDADLCVPCVTKLPIGT